MQSFFSGCRRRCRLCRPTITLLLRTVTPQQPQPQQRPQLWKLLPLQSHQESHRSSGGRSISSSVGVGGVGCGYEVCGIGYEGCAVVMGLVWGSWDLKLRENRKLLGRKKKQIKQTPSSSSSSSPVRNYGRYVYTVG